MYVVEDVERMNNEVVKALAEINPGRLVEVARRLGGSAPVSTVAEAYFEVDERELRVSFVGFQLIGLMMARYIVQVDRWRPSPPSGSWK